MDKTLPFLSWDEQTMRQIGAYGPVVLAEASESLPYVSAGVLINAPVSIVWEVISSFDKYVEYYPQTAVSQITRQGDHSADVDIVLKMEFTSFFNFRVAYSLRYVLQPPYRITWGRLKGDIEHTTGEWNLRPLRDGHCMAFYSARSDIRKMGTLIEWVIKKQPAVELALQTSAALVVAQATKIRCEAIFKESAPKQPTSA